MTRVKCKDEGHEGESDWVDREDCLLVPRYAGGNYRRAGRMYPTVICVACTSRYVAKIEAGEYQGALKVNRWSKSGLTYQYAQFRRHVGLPEGNPMSNEPKTAPEGTQDDSEEIVPSTAAPDAWDVPEFDAAYGEPDSHEAPHLAYRGLVPRKPGEFHHHFDLTSEAGLTKCVFCGQGAGVKCAGPKADEWEARMQARRELKERIFYLAYGRSPEGHAEAADAMAEFNAETLRLFPGHFREPTPEELEARERFRELVSAPLTPTFQQTAAEALRAIRERQDRELYEVPEEQVLEHRDVSAETRFAGRSDLHLAYEQKHLEDREEVARLQEEQALRPLHAVPLTEAKARRQQDELNEQIRAAKEAAWDEGREAEAEAHFADGGYGNVQHPENPYRRTPHD